MGLSFQPRNLDEAKTTFAFSSYLGELCVAEPVDELRLSDLGVADEDDLALVASLAQPVPDTAHLYGWLMNTSQSALHRGYCCFYFCC